LFTWDARATHRIGAWLFVSVGASGVDVSVAGAESVECDGFGDICGSRKIDLGACGNISIHRTITEF
jgi:hypothetical protein